MWILCESFCHRENSLQFCFTYSNCNVWHQTKKKSNFVSLTCLDTVKDFTTPVHSVLWLKVFTSWRLGKVRRHFILSLVNDRL